jgi:[glutamine synthetase] adenylyltransferase / [glutamine synthetase]-adenylyl-L-tyrosine phosphorylase
MTPLWRYHLKILSFVRAIIMTASLAPSSLLPSPSRFVQRWLGAAPERAQLLQAQAALALPQRDLAQALQHEMASGMSDARAMRRVRNLLICTLIERDLSGQADLAEVVQAMTEFADFAIQTLHQRINREMQALYGPPIGEESGEVQELLVLGMGKLGGSELNVSSDIDLIFTYAEDGDTSANQDGASGQKSLSNHEYFIRLGKKLIAALAEIAEDGFVFRVDMALRPNGGSGPLAASFNMVEEYLIVQGREWERYAWVKARAITGRASDIAALDAIVRPFVYRRYLDYGVIDAIRTMHGQIRAEVTRQERLHPDRSNNVKLGRGGIREIEFLAQVFQLIRGGRDHGLRDRSTRLTLRALAERELLRPEVVEQLLQSYTFLRNLEHRLQYLDDAQTHTLPANETDRNLVAQMMGLADSDALLQALATHRQFVAEQFDAIFSDKSHNEKAATCTIEAHQLNQDNLDVSIAQLQAHGFADAKSAAQRLHGMWQSSRVQNLPEASRTRLIKLINSALPLVQACSRAETTLGLLLDFLEIIARRSAYLSLLTEYPHALSRVITMMASSTWAATFLNKHPIVLDELLDGRLLEQTGDYRELDSELAQQLSQAAGDTERQMDILREIHHSQLFRLLGQDLAGQLSVEHLADHLSALADCMVRATLPAAWLTITQRHVEIPRFAVIAYGKLGGKELGYVSDLDVIFLFDDDNQDAQGVYAKLAQRFITWMTTHTAAGILFDIDTALRPDGASGMLVSSLAAFERYQSESAWAWEHQALSRARFCAGDASIGARFEQIRENVLRKPRQPDKLKADVVAMRKKMRAAHVNRSGLFDLKQDEGGMIDIEFIVQYLVLLHAAEHPKMCANIGNIALLKRCADLGLIAVVLAHEVGDAYRLMRKLQHQIRLQGEDKARVPLAQVEQAVQQVRALWAAVLG